MGTGILQFVIGNLVSVAAFGLLMAGVLKMFRMSSDLNEIKDLLKDIKHDGRGLAPQPAAYSESAHESPVALFRAVNAEAQRDKPSFEESPVPVRRP